MSRFRTASDSSRLLANMVKVITILFMMITTMRGGEGVRIDPWTPGRCPQRLSSTMAPFSALS